MSSFKIVGQIENIVSNSQYSSFARENYMNDSFRGENEVDPSKNKNSREVKVAIAILTPIFMFIMGVLGIVGLSTPTILALLYLGMSKRKLFLIDNLKKYSDSAIEFMNKSIENQEKELFEKLKTSKNLTDSEESIISGVMARANKLKSALEREFIWIESNRSELAKGRSSITSYLDASNKLKTHIDTFKDGMVEYLKKYGYEGNAFLEINKSEATYNRLVSEYMKYLQNEISFWSLNNIWALFTKEKLLLPDTFGLGLK